MSEIDKARSRVEAWLAVHHRASLDDFDVAVTPGYFVRKKTCEGRGVCREPIHACLLNEAGVRHTVRFVDTERDARGRFVSPYRTWRILREASAAGDGG